MFLPLGWLGAAVFVPRPRRPFDVLAVLPSLAFGAALAVALEFGQLYFPSRTVSINDIVAEVIGTLLGASLWTVFGASSMEWWRTLLRGGRATANAALAAYLVAYLVLSFSPFDFIISADELAQKAASKLNGWWLAPISCGRTSCGFKLIAEALAVLPFGWWLAMRRRGSPGTLAVAAVFGAGFGVVIELAQFFLVSGTSQGASALARAAGVVGGAATHGVRDRVVAIDWFRWGRPLVLAMAFPWLIAAAYVSGWFGGRWLGLDAALARLGQVEWMPFFYQYYSTEQALIRSTLVHLAMYVPVGVGVWLWGRRTNSSSGALAAALAAFISLIAESGKLFVVGKHPDYTDVLLAMAAAWAAATLLRWVSATAITGSDAALAPPIPRPAGLPTAGAPNRPAVSAELPGRDKPTIALADGHCYQGVSASWAARAASTMLLFLVALSLLRFPVWQLPLMIGLFAYAGVLLRWPLAYLLVLPAALPLLDLAPWSGHFFWDEFDLLLATTLGVRLLMALPATKTVARLPRTGLSLLALSVLFSAAIALWPPPRIDANAFTNYLSPFNALRVAKGYLWGGALLWLLWRDAAGQRDVWPTLRLGLGLGLLAAAFGAFLERLLFVGITDFGVWFRAAGLVSANHVGGAYLEAMLVVLTPFALASAVSAKSRTIGAIWFGVTILGAIAVLLTLSRAAAAAWLMAVTAFAMLWWFRSRHADAVGAGRHWRLAAAAGVLALAGAGALVAPSTALRDRIAVSGSDLDVRLAHWDTTLDLVRHDPWRVLFGTGLGSFPREFYLAEATTTRLAAYRLEREPGDGGRAYLALVGGRGMYLDQRVPAAVGEELRLSGLVHASREGSELAVALCEKSFLASVRCSWARVPADRNWQPFDVRLHLPRAAGSRIGPDAPVSLSLHNGATGVRIELKQLSLRGRSTERLDNGSFEHGLDRWLMHSDEHRAWRALNTWVQVAFEQGLLGVLAWLSLGFAIVVAAVRTGDAAASAAVGAAALAFVAVGCFDTLLDAPRILVLVALIAGAAILVPRGMGPPGAAPMHPFQR